MDVIPPTIGHNKPPEPVELLRSHLVDTHTALMERADELLGLAERLPPVEDMDDDWADKIAEAVKSCTKFIKHAEAARLAANDPHRQLIAACDAFFKSMSEPIRVLKTRMEARHLTPWQKKKAADELHRRMAAAAEAHRIADEERARARAEADALAELKRAEAAARQSDDAAELERVAAERAEQEKQAAAARERARVAAQERNVTERAAQANAADLSRSRSDLGALASLRTTYGYHIVNPDRIPRAYLSVNEPAIRAAIRAATRDGVCQLDIPGVDIFPITNTVVR